MGGYSRLKLIAELVRDESLKTVPYRDTVGKLTCGVGRNLDDCPLTPQECAAIKLTNDQVRHVGFLNTGQALQILNFDIDRTERALDRNLPWWRGLSDDRQRVLLNMCFNMGIGVLLGFTSTLALIHAGRYQDAARGMLASKWASQVHARANRLAAMMRAG